MVRRRYLSLDLCFDHWRIDVQQLDWDRNWLLYRLRQPRSDNHERSDHRNGELQDTDSPSLIRWEGGLRRDEPWQHSVRLADHCLLSGCDTCPGGGEHG